MAPTGTEVEGWGGRHTSCYVSRRADAIHPTPAATELPAVSSTRRRLQGAAWLTAAPIVLNFISVAANAYLIPALGPFEYGLWTTSMALVGATTILTNLGLRQVYIREISGADQATQQRLLREQLGLRLMLALCAAAIVPLSALLLRHNPRVVLTASIFALGLPLNISWTVLADVLTAREMFRKSAMASFWAGIVLTCSSVAAAALGLGAPGVAACYLLGPIVNHSLLAREVRKLGLQIGISGTWDRYKAMLKQSRQTASSDLVTAIRARLEGLYVPKLLGTTSYGVLSAGSMPVNRLEGFSDGIATAHFPQIATADTRGDAETARSLVGEMITLSLLVTLPLTAVLMMIAPALASIFYPDPALADNRHTSIVVMRIVSISLSFSAMVIAFRNSLQAARLYDQTARAVRNAAIISAFIGLGLILMWGIPGAAASYVVRRSLAMVNMMPLFRRKYPGVLRKLPYLRLTAPPAAIVIAGLLVDVGEVTTLVGTIIAAGVLLSIGGVVTLAVRIVAPSDLPFVGQYWSRFRSRSSGRGDA
jgi:O-antigen/teichoic acid export membrane protein